MFSGSRFFLQGIDLHRFFFTSQQRFLPACNLCKSKKLTHHRYPRKRKMTSTVSVWFAEFLKKGINDLPCRDCRYAMLHMGGCRQIPTRLMGKCGIETRVLHAFTFIESDIVPLSKMVTGAVLFLPYRRSCSRRKSYQNEQARLIPASLV